VLFKNFHNVIQNEFHMSQIEALIFISCVSRWIGKTKSKKVLGKVLLFTLLSLFYNERFLLSAFNACAYSG